MSLLIAILAKLRT